MSQTTQYPAEIAERQILTERVFDAPRELVFSAWTDPEIIGQWFGPAGFKTVTHEMNVTVGGQWLFTMHGPDDMSFPNKAVYTVIDPPKQIQFQHGSPDDFANPMLVTAIFDEIEDGKTKMVFTQLFPSKAQRDEIAVFAVEGNLQTFDKLAAYLATTR